MAVSLWGSGVFIKPINNQPIEILSSADGHARARDCVCERVSARSFVYVRCIRFMCLQACIHTYVRIHV
jgi:hypothetical protein